MSKRVEEAAVQAPVLSDARELRRQVDEVVNATPVIDMHTHLYPPRFGSLNLYGIDELLNYHYLIAELFRLVDVTPEQFWELSKTRRSNLIWETLFVSRTPLSEATRGVVAVLTALLWGVVFFLFSLAFPPWPGCVPLSDEEGGFSISACC
jgi:hypothetical protein